MEMAAWTKGYYLCRLLGLLFLPRVLLAKRPCSTNPVPIYEIYMTGGFMKQNGERAIDITCFFEEATNENLAVSIYRKTINMTYWEKLLEANPDVDDGRARWVKEPNDTRVSTPKGGLAEKWLHFRFSDVTFADTGYYSCKVSHGNNFNNAFMFVNATKVAIARLAYDLKLLNANTAPLMVINVSCACACANTSIHEIDLTGLFPGEKRYHRITLVETTFFSGDKAVLSKWVGSFRICNPEGGLQHRRVSVLIYNITPAFSGEFICETWYNDGEYDDDTREFSAVLADEPIIASKIIINNGALLHGHGDPSFRVFRILFCFTTGIFVFGFFP